jgi:hypothetical protein
VEICQSWPTTGGCRSLSSAASCLVSGFALILFSAAAFVVFSVWIENRFPKEDSKHALLSAAQRLVTKPVVHALGRGADAYLRKRAAARYMNTGLTIDETIRRFLDDRVDFTERRSFAYRLASVGSPECLASLLAVLESAPPEQKAFMAQSGERM